MDKYRIVEVKIWSSNAYSITYEVQKKSLFWWEDAAGCWFSSIREAEAYVASKRNIRAEIRRVIKVL